jgi:hypothetical protein
MERVDEVIGFLELAGWIIGVISLAAAITFAVIKFFPGKDEAATGKPAGDEAS